MHTGIDNIIHIKFSVFHRAVEIYGLPMPSAFKNKATTPPSTVPSQVQ